MIAGISARFFMMGLPSEITLFDKIADALAVLRTEEKDPQWP